MPVRSRTRAPAWNRGPPPPKPERATQVERNETAAKQTRPPDVRGEYPLFLVVRATNLAVHGTAKGQGTVLWQPAQHNIIGPCRPFPFTEVRHGGWGAWAIPAPSRENGVKVMHGVGQEAVGGNPKITHISAGSCPLRPPELCARPLRGDTADDTVLFGTLCRLLATSVAVQEPKLWWTSTSPWAG